MSTNKKSIALAAALLLAAGTAMAQTSAVRPSYQYPSTQADSLGPRSVRLGNSPVYVAPSASVAFGHDSNLNFASSNENSSGFALYGASVKADARDANSVFQMSLMGSAARYSDSSADNYTDSGARASYDMAFTSRSFLRLGWDYLRSHDPRGSTDRGFEGNPDRYFVSTPGIVYAYGAPDAQGRAEFYASRGVKRYLNNRDITGESDRNTKEYGAAFYWRVAPKTQFLVEARGTDLHYLASDSPLSGSESRYYAGVTWNATAATSGTVKIGSLEKKFDSSLPTFKGTSWEGQVTWQPRSYSKFDLYSSRQPLESTGLGSFILSDASGLIWTHGWNSVFSTEASARYQRDRYKDFDRNDDIDVVGLKANYKFRRWLTFGAEYDHTKRNSNIDLYDYTRDLWLVSANMSL